MKKIIPAVLYFLLVAISFATAQKKLSDNVAERVRFYITNNFKPDKGFLNDSCINTIVYLKFKIINKQIDSIDFSANSPVQIKDALQKAVLATNKQWKLTAGEIQQAGNKMFLLPVIVYYQVGCSPMLLTKEMFDKEKSKIPINPDIPMHKALNNMLKFDKGGNYGMLECVLINPVFFINYD
jgi:hypothetical protein